MRFLSACVLCGCLFAQPTAAPRFEAASIKPTPPEGAAGPWRFIQNSSGIDYFSVPIDTLIRRAWNLQDYELSLPGNFPQRWNVVARAPENTTLDRIPVMLQNLLIDRFGLQFHRETRDTAAFVLVPVKSGAKLKQTDAPATGLGFSNAPNAGIKVGGNVTLKDLAEGISPLMGRPVIDQTGLPGVYEISFDFERDSSAPGTAANLQQAIEDNLGLKLETRKVPVNVFVVDRIEKTPGEN